jgi:tetratricopeptide (TPR) repeat protein
MPFNQHVFRASCTVLLGLASTVPCLGSQDPLKAVRELYASAAYEDALSAVGKFDVADPSPEAEQYRVFCLVALGRVAEADQAVERLLTARPEYHPDPSEASPRIRALFTQVRQRIGPALLKRMYQRARAAMERKDRDSAVAEFEAMLRMADDPDVRTDPATAELKELGSGFLELSRAMPSGTPIPPPLPAPSAAPAAPRASTITPPVVIQQRLPRWIPDPASRSKQFTGAIRVQISAEGKVVAAEVVRSLHPAYDQLLVRAAREWLYYPGKRDGVDIASEKTVEVSLLPPKPGEPDDKSQ